MNTNYYKFGLTEPGNTSYYDLGFRHAYEFNDPVGRSGEETRPFQHSSTILNEQTVARDPLCEGSANTSTCDNPRECMFCMLFFFFFLMGDGVWEVIINYYILVFCSGS